MAVYEGIRKNFWNNLIVYNLEKKLQILHNSAKRFLAYVQTCSKECDVDDDVDGDVDGDDGGKKTAKIIKPFKTMYTMEGDALDISGPGMVFASRDTNFCRHCHKMDAQTENSLKPKRTTTAATNGTTLPNENDDNDDDDKNLLQCSRCKKVRYCSRECQKLDWKNHKVTCLPQSKQKMK